MKKKIMSIVLAVMMVFCLSATAFAADSQTYTDVPSTHWAYSSIESCTKKGLMQGVGDGKFDPEGTLTRAQVAQICYNAYRDKLKGGVEGAIGDVAANAWYRDAMHWMLANGIISGTAKEDGKTYCYPDAKASRKYVALALYRLSEKLGVELPKTKTAVVFSDVGELGEGYRTAIGALQQAGVISGFPDGSYKPDNSLTRAEAAKLFDVYTGIEGLEPGQASAVPVNPPSDGTYTTDGVYAGMVAYAEALGYSCTELQILDGENVISCDMTASNGSYGIAIRFYILKEYTTKVRYKYAVYSLDGTKLEADGGGGASLDDVHAILKKYA